MAQIVRPIGYGAMALAAAGLVWWSNQSDSTVSTIAKPPAPRSTSHPVQSDFLAADYTARFKKPKGKLRNLFLPLVENKPAATSPTGGTKDLDSVPADFASGEANWKFTGVAEINGVRSALLENQDKHRGSFVKEGDHWKSSRLERITGESISLVDAKGQHTVVMRFVPEKQSSQSPSGGSPAPNQGPNQPVTPVFRGPIGPRNLIMSPVPPRPPGAGG